MSTQQLVKKNPAGGYNQVFPRTFIDAIKDKASGVTLAELLQGFNMYFLSYSGNKGVTRLQVPEILRREGLWITYILYDHTVVTEYYNSSKIDDASWKDSKNWRVASNMLIGNISISSEGNWIVDGVDSGIKATGEQGITPLLRMGDNNKLQVTYNEGKAWEDISDYIVPMFRWYQGDSIHLGKIQISMDLGATWRDLTTDFTNHLRIQRYIGPNEDLPTGVEEGSIYMKGPYYAEEDTTLDNPLYRMWVYAWNGDVLNWQDNGEFQSLYVGIEQERGDNENKVMSQAACTREFQRKSIDVTEEEWIQIFTEGSWVEGVEYNVYGEEYEV